MKFKTIEKLGKVCVDVMGKSRIAGHYTRITWQDKCKEKVYMTMRNNSTILTKRHPGSIAISLEVLEKKLIDTHITYDRILIKYNRDDGKIDWFISHKKQWLNSDKHIWFGSDKQKTLHLSQMEKLEI